MVDGLCVLPCVGAHQLARRCCGGHVAPAYQLGIPGWVLLGIMPSVYGYFFIPNYPSDIATVNFDRSGTTVIGKYLLNHSFMAPGLIHVVTATIAGYCIAFLVHLSGLI